jgi:hypothetical protein
MLDVDTFLTALYVICDDFCQSHRPQQRRPGPEASLSAGEVIALSIFARWSRFASERDERDFYRYALSHLRGAFPTMPDRSQFNRLVRFHAEAIEEIALHLGQIVEGDRFSYQALDASAMPLLGMPSVVVMAGLPGTQISAGPTAWAGTYGLLPFECR